MAHDNSNPGTNVTRRDALKLLATAAVAIPALGMAGNAAAVMAKTKGAELIYRPTDPDMLKPIVPWSMTLTQAELDDLAVLADIIIPADAQSPSAGSLGAQHFINEWVSAPYPQQKADLVLVRGGLVWLNAEAKKRFAKAFAKLGNDEQRQICDDIRYEPKAATNLKHGARFFAKVRDLTATAFYTTEAGMADIGFIGNKPMASFDGPSDEVLRQLKLKS
ncbi:MAG: gluconate 2-dehydrogenase subunit 3 family protein [Gammaproteobacteria bacterium]|nr:gluconate 2-dehydrogenase subunit 3 family protein [Gammaproteobacteria bacterium]MBU1556135.1 gluconate 2-dehydrogenase subunit 3 family protein [Gammaproteobacteria bacterium]MBU2070749.1 gluconate 2-dehydrogenase subunit 3 family protein [Gammaproteobacteria bacterium]MBU2182740.1 gluconate 2-dehydrogenase subunit 3 family protein [Gammaproteobacteria bacterium]MBU2206018.1 gluconate 2-dehydrogenase subunit 3 family protein [Gammaproteobacteria bacterium]